MTAITDFSATPTTPSKPGAGLMACAVRLAETLNLWRERAQERRMLAAMSASELKDIGVSNVDAWREANKPVWRR